MASAADALIRNAPIEVLGAAVAGVGSGADALAQRLTYNDLAERPEQRQLLDVLDTATRLRWVNTHVPAGEDLEVWFGSTFNYDSEAVADMLCETGRWRAGATEYTTEDHVAQHLIAHCSLPVVRNTLSRTGSRPVLRAAAIERLCVACNTGELDTIHNPAVAAELLAAGASGVGRAELVDTVVDYLARGECVSGLGAVVSRIISDIAAGTSHAERVAELTQLCVAHTSTDRYTWGLELVAACDTEADEQLRDLAIKMLATGVNSRLPLNAELLYHVARNAVSGDPRVVEQVCANIKAATTTANNRSSDNDKRALGELVAHVLRGDAVTDTALASLCDAGYTDLVLDAVLGGTACGLELRCRLADRHPDHLTRLFHGTGRRERVQALFTYSASVDVLAKMFDDYAWVTEDDIEHLPVRRLDDISSRNSASDVFAHIAERLGRDPQRWRLFEELRDGAGTVGEVLTTIDAATNS